jgi:hypothetical protein
VGERVEENFDNQRKSDDYESPVWYKLVEEQEEL